MRKAKHQAKRDNDKLWLWLIVAGACLCLGIFIVSLCLNSPPSLSDIEKNEDVIAVPGYEGLTLQAGKTKQSVRLHNPPENSCYFVITLYLADGEMLWQSDEIASGKTSSPIRLKRELEKGTYANAKLVYSCFSEKDRKPLNGAETKLTLWVK